jgi:hypothetical protein
MEENVYVNVTWYVWNERATIISGGNW